VHDVVHASVDAPLPSSQASPGSTMPFPHTRESPVVDPTALSKSPVRDPQDAPPIINTHATARALHRRIGG
jgi:hypothetical protein